MVADMRIAEFEAFLKKFWHVSNWKISDVQYDVLAQHYGLETCWPDITSDFNVALFFATCYWDDDQKKWQPLTKYQTEKCEKTQYGMLFHMPSSTMASIGGLLLECSFFVHHRHPKITRTNVL